MATAHTKTLSRIMNLPSIILLFIWMIVPLGMTIYYSFQRYNLLTPQRRGFNGWFNYEFFITDPAFFEAIGNTLLLVSGVLAITIIGGVLLGILLNQAIVGRGIVRILFISPFFIMPTVSALIWKNMLMNPIYGIFAHIAEFFGADPVDFFAVIPLLSIIIIVAWQWLPFATLILLTAMQSLDQEQQEAADMDGASTLAKFYYITLPHLARAITVVILIETIFLLSIFAEILVTTNGGPGTASTNLTYMVYNRALLQYDIGGASAGGIIAVILANIVAIFLIRAVGKNLEA
ncbi:MAG: sugar ABC transporter permease [Alphaproteobacteria bacterium]|nr:sugar ABC transporter permease [Alphaproteobacteria bacterium]